MTNLFSTTPANVLDGISSAMQGYSKATMSKEKKGKGIVAAMLNAGWPSTHCISPKLKKRDGVVMPTLSTSDDQTHAYLKEQVVLGFDVTDQKLLALPTKAVDAEKMPQRKYLQQQINAILADVKKQVESRELAIAFGTNPDEGTPSRNKTIEVWFSETLATMQKKLENAETASFDILEMDKQVKSMQKTLHTKIAGNIQF